MVATLSEGENEGKFLRQRSIWRLNVTLQSHQIYNCGVPSRQFHGLITYTEDKVQYCIQSSQHATHYCIDP